MNPRSLKVQLMAGYAVLLIASFVLTGVITYEALRSSLTASLRESLLHRARQIARLVARQPAGAAGSRVWKEIDETYAPSQNDRFVRVTRIDGTVLYNSGRPADESFDPAMLPSPAWPANAQDCRKLPLSQGRHFLLAAFRTRTADGIYCLVEAGGPMDSVHADMRRWLIVLLCALPVIGAVAAGGAYALVKRSLSVVDRIAASAERISLHNLSQRLPVARTGDEIERLSVALNHMIGRLDSAFRQSRRFVADASHELRTPMTVLRGELESLVENPQSIPLERQRLASALEEVIRLSNIVEGLFSISRMDAGEAAAKWARFDLARVVAGTADQMMLLAADKKIEVRCDAPSSVWVEGDKARLKQVVVNLLDNAIKYTAEGGWVSLGVGAAGEQACLEVTDNGIGIAAEDLPKVFDRFFRVESSRSRELGGAGLGLSIVISICQSHQGTVEVSSSPGRGSVFLVKLPLARPMSEASDGAGREDSRAAQAA